MGRLVVAVSIVAVTATSVGAQSGATVDPAPKAASAHSVWFDTLVGLAIGGGIGIGAGAARKNFHTAECAVLATPSADFPRACDHSLEVATLAPAGAAIGAAVGFLVYHRGQEGAHSSSVVVSPTFSRTTKAMLVNWMWRR
jgi:hypothetical protein